MLLLALMVVLGPLGLGVPSDVECHVGQRLGGALELGARGVLLPVPPGATARSLLLLLLRLLLAGLGGLTAGLGLDVPRHGSRGWCGRCACRLVE